MKYDHQKSMFEQEISPILQFKVVLSLVIFLQFAVYAINLIHEHTFSPTTYYTIALAFALVYAIFNSVLTIPAIDQNQYFLKSLISYVLICIITITISYFLSGISIDEAGAFRWMFAVFTFVYIMILVIVRTMKYLVGIAQKNDDRMRGE